MKTSTQLITRSILVGLIALGALASSCNKMPSDTSQGTLAWSFSPGIITRVSDFPDTDAFILRVVNSAGEILYDGKYGDSPEKMLVNPGSYTVTVDNYQAVHGSLANYNVDKDSSVETLVILPRSIQAPAADPTEFVYDGSLKTYSIPASNYYTVQNNTQVQAGDYTVTLISGSGVRTNLFDLRDKSASVFQKIPGGTLNVGWSGEFMFELTLYQERSEPAWTV